MSAWRTLVPSLISLPSCDLIRKFMLTAFIFTILSLPTPLQAQEPTIRFERISLEQGLSNSTVFSIAQDQQGFMWFGTQDGLNKYDGYTITTFRHDPDNENSLTNSNAGNLYIDRSGTIWIGTWGGGINQFDPLTETFMRHQNDPDDPTSLSNDRVQTIYEDASGVVWIGTFAGGLNKFDRQTASFTVYQNDPNVPSSLSNNRIWRILDDGQSGQLWIGTNEGLNKFDPVTEQVVARYFHDPTDPTTLSDNQIRTLYQDRAGTLWVGTQFGLNKFDPATETFETFLPDTAGPNSYLNNIVNAIIEDRSGNLWVGTIGGGLNRFDRRNGTFTPFVNDPKNPQSLSFNDVRNLYEDRAGGLWVGTRGGGVNKFIFNAEAFIHFGQDPGNSNSLGLNDVRSVYEDRAGGLWIGTREGGLKKYDSETGQFTLYQHDPNDPTTISNNGVFAIYQDPAGLFWIGTDLGLNRFDPATEIFTRYEYSPEAPDGLSDTNVYSIFPDPSGALWLGTYGGGLNRFDPQTEQFTIYASEVDNQNSLSENNVYPIYQDTANIFWIGTQGGGLNKFDPRTEQFTRYQHDPDDPNSLSNNDVYAIYPDPTGILWLGTSDGLNKFDPKTEIFSHFRPTETLNQGIIYGVLGDSQGRLWLSGSKGLSKFDPASNTFSHFDESDGVPSLVYTPGSYHQTADGRIFFGGIGGLLTFQPDQIKDNPQVPPIVLTSFKLSNEEKALDQPLALVDEIPLTYQDEVISFEFAALDYTNPAKNQYAYKMEGFDQDWIEAGTRRFATYTNLDPGTYTFRVRGTNSTGTLNEKGAAITITIPPPPWQTWWAYSLYALAGVAAIASFIHYRTQTQAQELARQREALAQEQLLNEQLRQVDKLKDEFLANTSHELRTPLNGIIGLAESLIDGATGPLSKATQENLAMIALSGRRLSNLVNDVLDFSKLKHKTIDLEFRTVDVHALTEVVLALTKPLIGQKSLRLINQISPDTPSIRADENRMQQIMYNLIGNAIKFTPTGQVTVSAEVRSMGSNGSDASQLAITVVDTGVGIPRDQFEQIFTSFEQLDGSNERSFSGTGLGLAITKQLVALHHGEIEVDSTVGEGSCFTVLMPLSGDEAEATSVEPITIALADPEYDYEPFPLQQPHYTDGFNILIVDDEPINLQVLRNHLSLQDYAVTATLNGEEALTAIDQGLAPDLILLDVMMPGMSGYEVSQKLREDHTLFELPILMLTAKNQAKDMLAGFRAGANDYLTKPIRKGELLARVNTLLALKNGVEAHHKLLTLRQELDIAWRIQQSYLPPARPNWASLDLVCYSAPAEAVGGDFYVYHAFGPANQNRFAVAIGDTTGKGIPAAMFMAGSIASIQAILPEALSPPDLLTKLDQILAAYAQNARQNCALCYLDVILSPGAAGGATIRAANAGGVIPLIRQTDGTTTWLDVVGLPLGVGLGLDFGYTEATVTLAPGDMVVMASDGLIEAMNTSHEFLGFDRFEQIVADGPQGDSEAMLSYLRDAAADFTKGSEIHDDLTIVVLQV